MTARVITAKTTPLAISSLFVFNKTAKTIRSSMEPRVITLAKLPCDFMICIPVTKSKSVKKVMKMKLPNKEVSSPIINPQSKSILFIPFPVIKLLHAMIGS